MATNFMFLRIKTKTTLVILFCFLSPIVSAISFTKIRLPKNVNDPEALAFKLRIPPFFIGIANGRILKYLGRTNGFVEFGFTTPNRWKLHSLNAIRDGIAPPIKSVVCLLCVFRIGVLGPRGGLVTQLSIAANGEPYPFCNGVDVHQHTGNVYFTDATGVAVDEEEKIVMVTEFTANRTRKFTLQGGRSIIATIQPTPDNIKRTRLNKFGVAAARVDPRIDSGLLPTGVRINGNGTVLETVNPERWYGNKSGFEVQEFGTKLYIVSRLEDFIGVLLKH
ncbi:protein STRICTOSIDINE SYNTHASE-LIKE 12-like [Gossypium arboreum]|uniref:protein STRICTOSIDINE SYNTHASE-LIKE 12-like n=1 Tax=Gossypium arboreum TaxID=29729 RepID=UPI0022F166B8|nr:protein STRICTOSIDINE SYNTHASE-LIKE 12-like [Gossypium arboreum]